MLEWQWIVGSLCTAVVLIVGMVAGLSWLSNNTSVFWRVPNGSERDDLLRYGLRVALHQTGVIDSDDADSLRRLTDALNAYGAAHHLKLYVTDEDARMLLAESEMPTTLGEQLANMFTTPPKQPPARPLRTVQPEVDPPSAS